MDVDIRMTSLGPALDVGPLVLPLLVIVVVAGGLTLVTILALRDTLTLRAQIHQRRAQMTADLDDQPDADAAPADKAATQTNPA
ncbi:hypothetical protein [Nonomuraea sp. NPDC005650]|uniref:hypothetical protein n=1 Tax=Nonomuraea sp. NPDC005650 TaxID=3157045 RepID=UPI0033A87F63